MGLIGLADSAVAVLSLGRLSSQWALDWAFADLSRQHHEARAAGQEGVPDGQVRWCVQHDRAPLRAETPCADGVDGPCELVVFDETDLRCVGGCGTLTVAWFDDGTHGPGRYCGSCDAATSPTRRR